MFSTLRNRIAENRFDLVVQRTEDRGRQVGTPQACEAAVGHAVEYIDWEPTAFAAVPVDKAHFSHLVTQLFDSRDQAHFLGNVVTEPPEIDDVTAATELRRLLNEHHFMTGLPQPVGECRPRDAHSVDDNSHAYLRQQNHQAERLLRSFASVW